MKTIGYFLPHFSSNLSSSISASSLVKAWYTDLSSLANCFWFADPINRKLFLIWWTTHSCTSVFGNTELIASGKPLRPSTEAMSISCTPRLFKSVSTCNQNLAPSLSFR